MIKLPKLFAGLCAILLAVPAALLAQQAPPPGWIPQMPMTLQVEQARDSFMGPDFWTDAVPGSYQIQVVGTNLCLNRKSGDIRAQMPYLVLRTCNASLFDQNIELSPAAIDTPLFPATTNVRWRVNHMGECAGVARNVIFGAPRIDFNPCGMPDFTGGNSAFRGDRDQHMIMVRMGRDRYRFRVPDGRCWSVGGAVQEGSQIQTEFCDGRPGQTFQLIRQGGVADPQNHAAADLFGWLQIGSIEFPVDGQAAPDRFRRLSRFDLPGSDIANFATASDRGRSCAVACARNGACRAFTWTQPGSQQAEAWCWLKNSVPQPVANGKFVSGIVRP